MERFDQRVLRAFETDGTWVGVPLEGRGGATAKIWMGQPLPSTHHGVFDPAPARA